MRRDACIVRDADIQNADKGLTPFRATQVLNGYNYKYMQIELYTIELRDVHLFAHHGVMPQEQKIGAWFTIDIKLGISDYGCAVSDDIEGTVSYADVFDVLRLEMAKPSKLLENVCQRISQRLYEKFLQIATIEISLCKDTPPMGGDRLKAAVTLSSKR